MRKMITMMLAMIIVVSEIFITPIETYAKGPSTWSKNGHQYQVFTDATNWDEAQKKCKERGGHLVTITSLEENNYVYDLVSRADIQRCWIGLRRSSDHDNAWEWITGEKITLFNWDTSTGQPENNSETIAGFYDFGELGKWHDINTTDSRVNAYVCEWEYRILTAEKQIELGVGDATIIDAVVKMGKSTVEDATINYQSNKLNVAKVSSTGKIVAVAPGSCKITLKCNGANKTITVIVVPNKIRKMKIVSATRNSIKLSWEQQQGVSGYEVWMYDTDLEEYVRIKSVSKDFASATVTDLKKSHTYKFMVRGYVKVGSKKCYGEYSNVFKAKTK